MVIGVTFRTRADMRGEKSSNVNTDSFHAGCAAGKVINGLKTTKLEREVIKQNYRGNTLLRRQSCC